MAPRSSTRTSSASTPPSPYDFKQGAQVEISSNEEGFRGSWYIGSVIRKSSSSKERNLFLVQYDKLFKDTKGKIPLKEVLACGQLRPLPPPEEVDTFKFSQEVDAFYNDGWWEGVIVEERDDGKFGVFFTGNKEKLYFGKENLRLHREWINGEWLSGVYGDNINENKNQSQALKSEEKPLALELPDEQEKTEQAEIDHGALNVGSLVEVLSEEEGLEGALFAGKILKILSGDKYLIEYRSLRTEDDKDFLTEEVDAKDVRPSPPAVHIDRFKLLEEVDAFYNDAWWVGVIAKILPESYYIVYFKDTKEKLQFEQSNLRPHHDWIDGKWVLPSLKLGM